MCYVTPMNEEIKALKKEIKEVKAEMKANGIKRRSCFNGGHSPLSYSLNAQLFALTAKLANAEKPM
jgi:hypothetical protein